MTKPKPKPLPSVTEAVKLKCKDLYFRYTSLTAIAKATGVKYETVKEWVYGNPDAEIIAPCWFDERTSVSEDEFLEIRARNRYHAQLAAAEAIDDTVNSMELLRNRKNKKGEKIPLSPYELQALTNNILNIQKINHVNEISAPKRDELPANQPQLTSSNSEVINMEAVAFALTKDKGIMKLISQEGLKNGTVEPKKQQDESNSSGPNDSGGASEQATSGERVASRAVEIVEPGGAISRTVSGNTQSGVENEHRQSEENGFRKPETTRPKPSRVDNHVAGGESGTTDVGESGFSEPDGSGFKDPFEDEYS